MRLTARPMSQRHCTAERLGSIRDADRTTQSLRRQPQAAQFVCLCNCAKVLSADIPLLLHAREQTSGGHCGLPWLTLALHQCSGPGTAGVCSMLKLLLSMKMHA